MNYPLIKVCGMRDAQNIREVAALGVNLIGLIFYPKSPRYVESISSDAGIIPDYSSLTPDPLSKGEGRNMLDKQLKAEETKGETRNKQPVSAQLKSTQSKAPFNKVTTPLSLGEGQGGEAAIPKFVGVFVDDMPQNIVTAVYNYHLSYVQLHGDESPVMIDNLRRTLVPDIAPQIKIIKAISVSSAEDLKRCEPYEGHVDLFLFDTKCKGYGGSGQKYDWSVLEAYTGQTPFLLSGGIGPDDIDRLRDFHHPQCVGIDLNSKFETAPGMKDINLLQNFLHQLNKQ
ncbi:phosphoribosylanthranilate isomerase [Hallella absiana]|uniref:phosphoribosylanthranilate isomerase n=1 Tax=Hallella absiana TaxID=2925336 RepID=UPI0021C7B853|nr:phosphoribosylanthranilate isomerase [Hallella absiana]